MDYENPPVGDEVQVWFESDPVRRLEVRADDGTWLVDFANGSKGRIEQPEQGGQFRVQVRMPDGAFLTSSSPAGWSRLISGLA